VGRKAYKVCRELPGPTALTAQPEPRVRRDRSELRARQGRPVAKD